MLPEQRERLAYFRDYDRFAMEFFAAHGLLERSEELAKSGDIAGAREAIRQARPEEVIGSYARAVSHAPVNPGERALVVSLNLRWLPYFVSRRQALGLEPVRVKLQPTQHEPLAQGAGTNTFYFDGEHKLWKAFGEKESGLPAFADPGYRDELCRTGVRVEKPAIVRLGPIMGDAPLTASFKGYLVIREQGGAGRLSVTVNTGAKDLTVTVPPGEACAIVIEPIQPADTIR